MSVDIDGATQIDATVTVGVNDTGYDVKFFGDTSGAHMLWDASVDDLILAGAGRLVVPEGNLVLGSTAVTSTAAELNLLDGVSGLVQADLTKLAAVTSTAAELNLLDGVSGLVQADLTKLAAVDSTAAELNIVDGGTSATSTTVADADRVVMNDNGTMVQVAVTDLAAYFDDEITAMPNLTSVGTLTALAVDNITINGNDISSTAGTDLTITPLSGQQIVLDGTIVVDAGVVTGATSITSTAFVGGLTGNVTGNASGTALTVTQAAQSAITSLGTLTALTVDDVVVDGKVITMTGSSGDTFVTTVAANGATTMVTTDAASTDATLGITADGTITLTSTGDTTIDASGDIVLDADGGDIKLKDDGTEFGKFSNSSSDFVITNNISDKDIIFKGNDGGAAITALTFDMSAAGAATFNSAVTTTGVITGGTVEATTDTAAGDNAAMGYTAAEGLILTGQGSTSDITLKNDADAVVFTVPTGTDDILFPDSAQVIFGAGSDLSINHDGAHSNIVDSGTGDLRIRADNLRLSRSNDSEIFLYCTTDAGVQIYHNGAEKLTTVDKGVQVASSKNGVDTELTITETAGNNAYIILKSNRDQSGSTYRDNAINSYARGNGDTDADVMGTSIEFASIQGSSDGKIKENLNSK